MTSTPMLMLGLLLVSGLILSLVAARFNFPRIAAYAVAGFLWSEDLLGSLLNLQITQWSQSLTQVALAIIAYTIGGSITSGQLRKLGKTITFCTIGESMGAMITVFIAIYLYQPDIVGSVPMLAIILAALAATTDPAATVAVIHQYRAKGPLTSSLLGVVALDDVVGIILFSLVMVLFVGLNLSDAVTTAGLEIFGAIGLGSVIGFMLAWLGHKVRKQNFLLPMVLSALFLSQGLADLWHVSPLLTAMTIGFSARSVHNSGGERLFASVEYLEELVFVIFFTLAGAHFKLAVFLQGADLVLIYILASVIGKIMGIKVAARFSQAPPVVEKYLGFCIVPQAGVAIGLALSLLHRPGLEQIAILVLNLILASTLIYQVIGPFATRYAIVKAGEVSS